MSAALYGLLLAGGRSSRMGRDKAALAAAGRTQLERAMALLAPHVERTFVSVRADQRSDPLRAGFTQIVDRHENLGPIAGLLAAQAQYPEHAWLVLACDLPLLDTATLAHLLRHRAVAREATAYRSSRDALPEPLCAIYEPSSQRRLAAYVAGGRDCPRKFLMQADVELLAEPNPRALDNANTPEEYAAAMTAFDPSARSASPSRKLNVQYYALLREQAGRREEAVVSDAPTAAELYGELARRHRFSLAPAALRVAINGEFAEWSTPLADGDALVFIPPVAGG